MNKKFVSTVIAVVVGLAAFAMLSSAVSFLFESILSGDLADIKNLSDETESLLSYIQNSAIGITVFTAAAIVSYFFTYFLKSKRIFGCISSVLSLALAAFAIAFIFDLRGIALQTASESVYTAATAYFVEFITLLVSALILCAYFTVITVRAFTAAETNQPNAEEKLISKEKEETNEAD